MFLARLSRPTKNGFRPICAEEMRKYGVSPIYAESTRKNGFRPITALDQKIVFAQGAQEQREKAFLARLPRSTKSGFRPIFAGTMRKYGVIPIYTETMRKIGFRPITAPDRKFVFAQFPQRLGGQRVPAHFPQKQ